jgi:hypothetical protein
LDCAEKPAVAAVTSGERRAKLVCARFSFGNDSFQPLFFGKLEKIVSSILNIAADLNAGHRSNYLLKPIATLQYGLGCEITPVIPKQIEEKIDSRFSFAIFAAIGIEGFLFHQARRSPHRGSLNAASVLRLRPE